MSPSFRPAWRTMYSLWFMAFKPAPRLSERHDDAYSDIKAIKLLFNNIIPRRFYHEARRCCRRALLSFRLRQAIRAGMQSPWHACQPGCALDMAPTWSSIAFIKPIGFPGWLHSSNMTFCRERYEAYLSHDEETSISRHNIEAAPVRLSMYENQKRHAPLK